VTALEPDEDVEAAVVAHLERAGVPYELVPCDPDLADTAAFCEAYGVAPEDSANTIVVVGKRTGEPEAHVACVVLATTRLDVNHAVRRRLGVRKASFAGAEATVAITGMRIGGVTPFGLPVGLPVWVDARVLTRESVIVGGGSRRMKVRVPPAALLAVDGAEAVDGLATPAGGG
jgi:prolyl-tRNA editing enzyme YbaK/EbsC (Cys-tRNA(Pro) deacylase)